MGETSIQDLLETPHKKTKKVMKNICIRLDPQDEKKLKELAQEECCGFATMVRSIVKKHLARQKGL